MPPPVITPACRRRASGDSSAGASYLHYTPNETIGGVEFPFVPESAVPLVADMSSTILSRPIDVGRFGLIYAGAQKNIGPAGIVRRDRARRSDRPCARRDAHGMRLQGDGRRRLDAQHAADLCLVLAGLVFKWLKRRAACRRWPSAIAPRPKLLYRTIDESPFTAIPWRADAARG